MAIPMAKATGLMIFRRMLRAALITVPKT
jgi:hypothetical protein